MIFANNTILPYFFLFFLMIDLYFSINTVIAQIFNPIAELLISTGTVTNEAEAEIQTHSLTTETENRTIFKMI